MASDCTRMTPTPGYESRGCRNEAAAARAKGRTWGYDQGEVKISSRYQRCQSGLADVHVRHKRLTGLVLRVVISKEKTAAKERDENAGRPYSANTCSCKHAPLATCAAGVSPDRLPAISR